MFGNFIFWRQWDWELFLHLYSKSNNLKHTRCAQSSCSTHLWTQRQPRSTQITKFLCVFKCAMTGQFILYFSNVILVSFWCHLSQSFLYGWIFAKIRPGKCVFDQYKRFFMEKMFQIHQILKRKNSNHLISTISSSR
jgi:hypothetical protein